MHNEASAVLETAPAKTRPVPRVEPVFQMPKIGVGRPVIWQPDPRTDHDRFPAWVTVAGDDAISVSILMEGKNALEVRDGVRHKDDPRWTEDNGAYSGVWSECEDECARDAAFERLVNRVNELSDRLAMLEQVVSK